LGREFAREWNADLMGDDDDEEEDGEEDVGWSGMRALKDREKEGWGREPLFKTGERSPAEDKCK